MKRTACFLISALAAVSCHLTPAVCPEEAWTGYDIIVKCDDCDTYLPTRTSFPEEALTRISDVNIWIYHNGVYDSFHSGFFIPDNGIHISFGSYDESYNIYMLANVGEQAAPELESDLASWMLELEDYGTFRTKGFPMANSFPGYTPGCERVFLLKKLVGEYVISFTDNSPKMAHEVTSVRLMNCALQAGPFAEGLRCTSVMESGDYLTWPELDELNAGAEVSLFFLENLQGVLLPGNTDPAMKTPENIAGAAGFCTYIEVDAAVTTPTAGYGSVRYRAYLGEDTTKDFNIRRNTRRYLTLNFDSDMIVEEEWRVEADEPEIIGTLHWDTEEVYTMNTGSSLDDPSIRVICPDSEVGYHVSWNAQEASDAMLTVTEGPGGRYSFHTDHPIDALAPRAADGQPAHKDVHLVVSSYDGLIRDTAIVHIVHHAYPVRLSYDHYSFKLEAEAWHPMGMKLDFRTIECTVSGEGHYQKSGIAGDSWQTATDHDSWSVPVFAVSTDPRNPTRTLLEERLGSSKSVYGMLKGIEKHTVLYDHTWLGTDHNYYPMYPTAVTLEVELYAYTPNGGQVGNISKPMDTNCPFYIYNNPDYVDTGVTYYLWDGVWINKHTSGPYDVHLSGSDLGVMYTHTNGTVFDFTYPGQVKWHGQACDAGREYYTIGMDKTITAGDGTPRAIKLSIHNGSRYDPAWFGGSIPELASR